MSQNKLIKKYKFTSSSKEEYFVDDKGLKQWISKTFNSSGELDSDCTYLNGLEHGIKNDYQGGVVRYKSYYNNGVRVDEADFKNILVKQRLSQ